MATNGVWSDGRLVVTAPAGQGVNLTVAVTVDGQTSVATGTYTYNGPTVTRVAWASAPTAGGQPVTITGADFGASPLVTIGGVTVTVVPALSSPTTLVVISPAGEGRGREVLVTAAGRPSTGLSYDYDPPAVTALSVTHGPTQGGTTLTLTGANFGTFGFVTIGGRLASPTGVPASDSQITVTVPAGHGASRDVVVTVGTQTVTLVGAFSYDPPSVSSVTSAFDLNTGNLVVTITGANFGTDPSVTIGGVGVSVVPGTASDTQVVVTQLPGSRANLPVVVTASSQSSVAFLWDGFTPGILS